MLNRERIERTASLEEAIREIFGIEIQGRISTLNYESMEGELLKVYSELARDSRNEAYRKIAEDFVTRCSIREESVLDVGCGNGLLTEYIAQLTEGIVIGIESSIAKSYGRVLFLRESAYNLVEIFGEDSVDYVFCRNTLHRFREPKKAIKQMNKVARKGVYIRDLKRDSKWKVILKRIGEERWRHPILVKDYIGAMAQMFTQQELGDLLKELGINNYEFSRGDYSSRNSYRGMPEYELEVDFVCLIRK